MQGNSVAQYHLGRMYDKGRGVPEDDRQAVFWYEKAAEQRVSLATLITAFPPVSTSSACKPLLVGFHGAELKDPPKGYIGATGIMQELLDDIESWVQDYNRVEIKTRMYGWRDKYERRAERYIKKYIRECPSAPIVLIGHSYGGDSAYDIGMRNKRAIDLIVTLDPVSHDWLPKSSRGIRWWNAYRRNVPFGIFPMWPLAVIGDCDALAALGGVWGAEMGADRNIDVTAASDDHCDATGMYKPFHKEVVAVLTK